MLEVFLDPFRLTLATAKMRCRGLDQLQLGARRCQFCCRLLEVGVGHFVGVQFGAVDGQVKHLNMLRVFSQPLLNRLAVVHPQGVQDEEHFLLLTCDLIAKAMESIRGTSR